MGKTFQAKSIKVAVVGAAGFAGIELVRLILNHVMFDLVAATSDAQAGEKIADMYPAFKGVTDMEFCTNNALMKMCGCVDSERAGDERVTGEAENPANTEAGEDGNGFAQKSVCDIAFLAVPHTAALAIAPKLLKAGVSVIDLSADYRLDNPAVYEHWYETEHTSPELLKERAFGLPELFEDELDALAQKYENGEAVLVGCAGCYPTATSLAAAPACRAGLAYAQGTVVVDAISGVTGAGKKATQRTHFCFANENLEAYGIAKHRHTPEIAQILGLDGGDGEGVENRAQLVFTPHLAPLNRGLLSTVNIPLDPAKPTPSQAEIDQMYDKFYANSKLVTYVGAESPRTASVAGTCRAQVSATVNEKAHMLVCVGAIDNLGKGAAGQAVQCANIVCDLPEDVGLNMIACPV